MPANRSDNNDQIEKAADAGRNAADDAARTARTFSEGAAKAGEQATRAGADIARRGAETARDTLQSGLNTAVESFQRVTDQFTQVLGFAGPQAEELARRSSQNLEAVSEASSVLARGAQEISQEWFGLAQDRLAKNMDAMNRLASCRSVQDFVAVQSDWVRDNLQQRIDASRRVAELSIRVADEAARAIQVLAESKAERIRRVA
jgi:phasin family protein